MTTPMTALYRGLGFDIRLALRRLWQQPVFTIVAVAALALGLGANAAIFTLLHAVTMQKLPVERPTELYRLGNTYACCVNSGLQGDYALFSTALVEHLRTELGEFEQLAAFQANTTRTAMRPAGDAPAVSAPAAYVSANYFDMLGVRPALGRLIQRDDDRAGATPVLVLSHRTWTDRFGADPSVVGRVFTINGVAVTVVGVAQRGFFGESIRVNPAGLWLPLGQEPVLRGSTSLRDQTGQNWLYAIGRMKPGSDPASLQAHATRALQTWLDAQPFVSERDRRQLPQQRIVVTSAATGVQVMQRDFGRSLMMLLAMSAVVLLIAVANLANLLLARADRAQTAIRAALGGSPVRLLRQSLAEGLVLSLLGCAAALVVAALVVRGVVALAFPPTVTLAAQPGLSPAIVLFTLALTIVTGVFFAAVPAWAMARVDPSDALRGLAREGADVSFVPRRSLVVAQVALSLVLLVAAGLLTRSLLALEQQTLGFQPEARVVTYLQVPASYGEQPDKLAALYASMQQRLEQVPGIGRATYALYTPMQGDNWSSVLAIDGRPVDPDAPDVVTWNRVGPDYFDVTGTRILRGRGITAADTPTSEHIAVVNGAFARRYFDRADPVGQHLGIGGAERSRDYRVVGVVDDVKYTAVREPARPMVFFPVMQLPAAGTDTEQQVQSRATLIRAVVIELATGAHASEPAIRQALTDTDPDLAVMLIVPMPEQVSGNFRRERLLAWLAGSYGALALLVAALGLYAVLAYRVRRRRHEIGVRMALGADRARIVRSIVGQALIETGIGVAIGVPLTFAATRVIESQLYEVTPRDPLVVAGAAIVLLIAAAVASAIPARVAAAVDPARSLRSE